MTANQKMIITFIIGLLVGAGAVWLWYANDRAANKGDTTDDTKATSTNQGASSATPVSGGSVAVSNQPAGTEVIITNLVMPKDGWVAIHEDLNGVPGSILGAHRYDAGTVQNADISLLRGTQAGMKYYAVLHEDDGDRAFDPHVDMPMQGLGGELISATFTAQ